MRQTDAPPSDPTNVLVERARTDYREQARLFQALADEARLLILHQLRLRGEVCACEFSDCCGLAQPTVSYHLKILREAGLVEAEKRGSWVYYRLSTAKADSLHDYLP